MAPLDPEAVAGAPAVLGDVSEWRLPAPRAHTLRNHLVHSLSATDSGYDRVRQLWDGCGSVLGMTKPIDALGPLAVCPPVDPHGGHVGGSAPADP